MTIRIGPREIYYTDEDNIDHPITIWAELLGPQTTNIEDEEPFVEEVGALHIESEAFSKTLEVRGSDHFYVLHWLMKLSDLMLQNRNGPGFILSCIQWRDVQEPLDIYAKAAGSGIVDFVLAPEGPVPVQRD